MAWDKLFRPCNACAWRCASCHVKVAATPGLGGNSELAPVILINSHDFASNGRKLRSVGGAG